MLCVKRLISTKRKKVFLDLWLKLFLSPGVQCNESPTEIKAK